MATDIQIAREHTMLHIEKISDKLNISRDDLELYGKYKAKLSYEAAKRINQNKQQTKKSQSKIMYVNYDN